MFGDASTLKTDSNVTNKSIISGNVADMSRINYFNYYSEEHI